jgi:antirestriction protein ArdC
MAEYYSTAFHELTHSTGHSSRLDRISRRAFFGSEDYSREELVAEIGAAALLNHCGIETGSSFKNSAAYIQSWLRALRNDKKMIVTASGAAAKAFELITGTAA